MNSGAVIGKYKNIFLFVLYLEVELLADGGGGGCICAAWVNTVFQNGCLFLHSHE